MRSIFILITLLFFAKNVNAEATILGPKPGGMRKNIKSAIPKNNRAGTIKRGNSDSNNDNSPV